MGDVIAIFNPLQYRKHTANADKRDIKSHGNFSVVKVQVNDIKVSD
jgi:hypothetical protein